MSNGRDQFRGYRHPFVFGVHYMGGIGDYPRTLTELAMTKYSAELRRIPDWWKHFGSQDVREEWAEMARGRSWNIRTPSTTVEVCLSEKQIQYVLDELAGYAALRDHEHGCQVSCFERIWELDLPTAAAALNDELSALRREISAHPWDPTGICTALIDPYLHCLVYNHTLVARPHSRQHLRTLPSPSGGDIYTVSPHFSLLPADVSISPTGAASFASYINNLHPQTHARLYTRLAQLLTAFVPLFEHTLTDLHRNNPLAQRIPGACRYAVWDEPEEPEYSDDEEGWAAYEREMRHWVMNRPIELPDVPDGGYPGGLQRRKHVVSLKGRRVQVIVSVEEMKLEPGGPSYPGSHWHVEGMRNERIVACGEYYTSMENITPTALEFRMAVTYPRGFAAGDAGATTRTWGLRNGDSCHQHIGSRPLAGGLALVFPNLYQHRQTPFSLLDRTRPGHLSVVRFWLVDPEIEPVVSTARVAPQQESWIRDAVGEALGGRLPTELVELVMERVEGLMRREEAEEHAKALRRDMLGGGVIRDLVTTRDKTRCRRRCTSAITFGEAQPTRNKTQCWRRRASASEQPDWTCGAAPPLRYLKKHRPTSMMDIDGLLAPQPAEFPSEVNWHCMSL
ncbi:putative protein of unknown function (DUF4246) [Lyophyllum shimeji]|uniref:DUF4246 domain-containing protein n=1 Tax=Lyophyllum shimeji TaxID=47721 RepID=A0A9P3PX34_LYOSH|nr:putative protein of unknown function (DUF4246) [Lyophyllum shimeji]